MAGAFCDGPTVFTCVGNSISTSFGWILNDTAELTLYTFEPFHTYPYDLESITSGVRIQVANATLSGVNSLNVISTLTVMSVSVLNGSSLHCADNFGASSATINITTVSLGVVSHYYVVKLTIILNH